MSVHWDHNTVWSCDHICSSWFTFQKSSLSEEVTLLVFHNFLRRLPRIDGFGCNGSSFLKKEEIVAWLTFLDNHVVLLESMFNKCIGEFRSFIRLHGLENWNRLQESFIFFSTFLCSAFHDMIECIPVEFPKHRSFISCDCCCSWGVVKKS